jgi:hypothetical protein
MECSPVVSLHAATRIPAAVAAVQDPELLKKAAEPRLLLPKPPTQAVPAVTNLSVRQAAAAKASVAEKSGQGDVRL